MGVTALQFRGTVQHVVDGIRVTMTPQNSLDAPVAIAPPKGELEAGPRQGPAGDERVRRRNHSFVGRDHTCTAPMREVIRQGVLRRAARVDQGDRVRKTRPPASVVVLWIGWLIVPWRASAAHALSDVARVKRVLPSAMQSEVAGTATSDSLSYPNPSLDLRLCRLCALLSNRSLRCR